MGWVFWDIWDIGLWDSWDRGDILGWVGYWVVCVG